MKQKSILCQLNNQRRNFSLSQLKKQVKPFDSEGITQQSVYTSHHGHFRKDLYNQIRYDTVWQNRILKREEKIFKQWQDMTILQYKEWKEHVFKRTDPGLQDQIPEKYGEYIYFVRENHFENDGHVKSKNSQKSYVVYCRHPASTLELKQKMTPQQQEKTVEVVLDMMKDITFIPPKFLQSTFVDKIKMNDKHDLIAFTVNIGNQERLTAGIKSMKQGSILSQVHLKDVSQIEFFGKQKRGPEDNFSNYDDVIYFVQMNEHNRPYIVKRMALATGEEQTIFIDDDPTHYIDISVSKDGKCLFINNATKEDGEIWVIQDHQQNENNQISQQDFTPKLLIKRSSDVRVHIEHIRDFFIRISNSDTNNKQFKLQILKDEHLNESIQNRNQKWVDFLAPGKDDQLIISEFDCFENFIAVYVKQGNKPNIVIQDLDSKEFNFININGGEIGEIQPMMNNEYKQDNLKFTFSSPFVYQQSYKYDHKTKNTSLIQDVKLIGSPQIVRNQFEHMEFLVPSHDGEEVPLNIYFKKGSVDLNRRNRVLLEGYGAYGLNMSQGFSIVKTSAMERGWIIADAYVRGGGEKGINWHEQGKLHNKPNSMLDFISCAEYLIAKRITHPNLLASKGQSAGGLMVAQACLNMRPDLFRACILDFPFLDVLNSLLDENLPLSATDYLELGNPVKDQQIYKLINSYCPYQNLSNQEYPSCLIQSSVADQRVPIWGTLKFIEKLRDLSLVPFNFPDFGHKNIVCRLHQDETLGHFGAVDNDVNLQTSIYEFAWLDFIMFTKNSK